jgi:hypothetical protein
MATPSTVTDEQVKTATNALRAVLDFIETKLPRDVTKGETKKLQRARKFLMTKKFDTSEKLQVLADALLWAIDLIPKNYDGPEPVEIEDAFRVLHAWGYVN